MPHSYYTKSTCGWHQQKIPSHIAAGRRDLTSASYAVPGRPAEACLYSYLRNCSVNICQHHEAVRSQLCSTVRTTFNCTTLERRRSYVYSFWQLLGSPDTVARKHKLTLARVRLISYSYYKLPRNVDDVTDDGTRSDAQPATLRMKQHIHTHTRKTHQPLERARLIPHATKRDRAQGAQSAA